MDDKLKQRLIGALVLIIAAVVFLPMLLSGQDETVRVEVEVPEAPVMDETEIRTAAPIEMPEPEPVPDIPPPGEIVENPEQPVTSPAQVETKPVPEPPEPEVAAPAIAEGSWVVQLGSFSGAANAEALRDTLVSQGYNAYTLSARVDGSDITRVFVGPLIDRAGATKLRDELAKRHGMQGLVTAYDVGTGKR
ncbi:SPOR domain-containing protein [Halopseudomonas salina]|uniref:Cell division protein n=1 Tax=Halopseudomonas salina TaxID=1323744 RepID=A0ABQ1Q0U9_9GAMM|nr:SPOR domain-containing protein [Halopseudomonas salina]GGD08628.1 cell division protein [Halopseudomonas salina]